MRITEWPSEHRPRERLLAGGARALSDPELLALFLRTGVAGSSAVDLARGLLKAFGGLRGLLEARLEDLATVKGMGPAKYALLQAALELGRRLQQEELVQGDVFATPSSVRNFLRSSLARSTHECFAVLFLDSRNRLLAYEEMFRGSLHHAHVYVREVVREALVRKAAGVILAHNHPSGVVDPSAQDESLTHDLQAALGLLEIKLHDHFIVAGPLVYSFSEHGLL